MQLNSLRTLCLNTVPHFPKRYYLICTRSRRENTPNKPEHARCNRHTFEHKLRIDARIGYHGSSSNLAGRSPPSDGGDARLVVHVEDNIVVDAHYNADGTLV